jgi:hypothetical protein
MKELRCHVKIRSYVHLFEFENFCAWVMAEESLDSRRLVVRQPNLSKLYDMQISIYRSENMSDLSVDG